MDSKRNLVRIVGSGGGKGGSHEHYEADDNMFARQSAAFIDAIAEGPIKGLVYGDASILVDEVRLRDVDQVTGAVSGTTNVNNFSVITADGTADQTPDPEFFSEFPTASTMQEIGSPELLKDEPQYFTLSSGQFEKNNADYIKVTMATSGMQQITKTGKTKGDVHETYVYFDIDFRWINDAGTPKTQNMFRTGFQGKVSGNYAHTFGFNIETFKNNGGMTDWSVKVTRVGGRIDTDDLEVTNAVFVNSIEVSIADKLSYPYTAYVAGTIDAEQFSGVPSRGYEIDGKLISIPSNHVPIDYNGRRITVDSASGLAVGDTISQTGSISALTATGNADDGYEGIATLSGNHGVPTGKTFITTITTTANGVDDEFWEGTFIVESTAVNQFTYKLNQPYNQTTEAFKILDSTTCAGTKTASLFTGGIIDKIVGTTVYLRDVPASSTVIVNQDISNGTVTPSVTAGTQVIIPANYRRNSATEKLTATERDWDGTFYTVWCNNPAWVFNDLITNKIYGLGNYLSQVQINKWELYQIGRYCDELVPAGVEAADLLSIYTTADTNYIPSGSTGEHEPRFSANLVIAGKQEAFKVLNDVVSMFRGMIYWLNGEAYVVQDSEKDPVYQFTNANVINGEFKYEGTSRKTRTNQIIVGWNNPQDYYRSRQEIVELEETLQKDDEFLKPDSTTAFGCTSRGQARRLGKWKLLSNNLHTNTVTFDTSFNGAFLRPGDIIQVIDQHKDGKSWGGRVASGSDTDDIIIDRKPTGFTDTGVESGYAAGDYRLTCSFVGKKVVLAQDTIDLASATYVRGDELPKTYLTTILIEDGGTGYAAGTTVAVSGSATADVLVEGGVITRIDVVQATGYSSNPTLTIGNAGSGTGAVLTPYLSDTEEGSKNLKDDDGNLIFTQYIPFHYTETRTLDEVSNSGKTLGVSAVFSAAPTSESIWILSRAALTTGKEKYEARLYRILQLTEKDGNVIEIQALDYNATKFDNVDKNEALSPDRQIYLPDSFLSVPPVTNIDYVASIAYTAENAALIDRIAFNWDPPRNDDNTPYTFVRHYEIFYSKDNIKWFKAGTSTNTEIVKDSIGGSGPYYVRVYTISLQGKRSPAATATLQVDFQRAVGPSEGSVGRSQWTVNKIGTISGSFGINGTTGSVAFTPANFFHNDGINEHTVTSQPALDFSGLSDGEDGWVYFSHKENKFKAMTIDLDSTVGNASYYGTVEADQFYPVGSNVFAVATGTLSFSTDQTSTVVTSNQTITGDGTNFQEASLGARDGELHTDNVFSFTKSGITYHHRARNIVSDTVLKTHAAVQVTSSSQAWNKPTYLTDYTNDSIMGKVHRTSATSYYIEAYGIRRAEGVYNVNGINEVHTFIGDADDGEIESAHYTAYYNEYNITKDGQSFTFKDDGTATNTFGLSCTAVTGFDATNKISITADDHATPGRITIADNSLDTVLLGTATIRITDLGTSTVIADRVLSFTKVTGGSGSVGLNAKTVRLEASDYSIVYDADGLNPSPSGPIVLTASAQNLTNAGYFKYTGEEITPEGGFSVGTVGDPVTGDTFNFVVPANVNDLTNPATVKVELQDGSSGGAIASDSATIFAVQPGTSGYTVSQTNPTHAVAADENGAISVAQMDGTGTIFEVFQGATNLIPVMDSSTPGLGEYKITVSSDTNISVSTNVDRVNAAGAEGTTTAHNRVKYNKHATMNDATAEIEYAVNCENLATVLVNQTFTRTNAGEAGTPAKTVLVSPSSHIMTISTEPDEGQRVLTFYDPQSITVRAITNNTTADGTWSSTSGGGSFTIVSSAHDADPGPSVTVSGAQLVDGMTVTYELAGADGGGSDSTTLEKVALGSNVINPIFTNESHTFVTDSDGASNAVYTGSGMDIYCYEGGGRLDYVTGTPVAGEFTVAQGSLGGLTGLAITANGTTSGIQTLDTTDHFLRVGVITGHTTGTDVYTIPYTISGRASGSTSVEDTFSFTKYQTLTKAKRGAVGTDAKGISLTLGSKTIAFDNSTGTPVLTPAVAVQDIVCSANLQNISGTPTYSILTSAGAAQDDLFFTNGDDVQTATAVTIDASTWSTVTLGKSLQIKVSLVHDSVTYTDTESVHAVFSGETGNDAVVGFLTNENFTAPTLDGGNPVVTNGTGRMKVFVGATDDSLNWTYAGDATKNGLSFSVDESHATTRGQYALSGTWSGSTSESFDITASKSGYDDVVKTFSVSRATDGADADPTTNTAIVYAYKRSTTTLGANDDPDATVTVGLTGANAGKITTSDPLGNSWTKIIPSGEEPLYIIAATASGTGSSDTIADSEWTEPVLWTEGLNQATVFLYQVTTANTAPSAGSNSTHDGNPEGNSTYTFSSGLLSLTTANGWSVINPGVTATNKYLWVTTATAIAATSTDVIPESEWAEPKLLTVFGEDGDPAYTLHASNENHTFSGTYTGVVGSNDFTNTFTVKRGETTLTYNATATTSDTWRFSVGPTGSGGIATNKITNSSGVLTVANDSVLVATGTSTLVGGITGTIVDNNGAGADVVIGTFAITLNKNLAGGPGDPGVGNAVMYKRTSAWPGLTSGQPGYNNSTLTATIAAMQVLGWSTSIPAGTALLWESHGIQVSVGSTSYVWGIPYPNLYNSDFIDTLYGYELPNFANISIDFDGNAFTFNESQTETELTANLPAEVINANVDLFAGSFASAPTASSYTNKQYYNTTSKDFWQEYNGAWVKMGTNTVDLTVSGAGTVNASNYTNTTYTTLNAVEAGTGTKLSGIAANATNNNVGTGNTAAMNAVTGTEGDIWFDTTTLGLYVWE